MKTSTFLLIAFLAFNTNIVAQTCEPGLEQIPSINANDWLSANLWVTAGNQICANLETNPNAGVITGVKYVRSGLEQKSVKLCVYDINGQLLDETDAFLPPGDAESPVDTMTVLGLATPIPVPTSYYIGLKFSGPGTWLVRKFDGATGTRLRAGNLFNEPFHPDLSVMPGTIIEDGLYAIWAIVEDCVAPLPGCTDDTACNYDPLATEDDGSCSYPAAFYDCGGNCLNDSDGDGTCDELEVFGCTDDTACNYDPLATEENLSCDWTCLTPCQRCDNGDGIITSSDLTIMLDVYGTFAEPGLNKRDINDDGMHSTADILSLLACFGEIVE